MAYKNFELNDMRGGNYYIGLNVPDGYTNYSAHVLNATRFKTAVVKIEASTSNSFSQSYQIIDLETGRVIKAPFSIGNAQHIWTSDSGTTFYTSIGVSNGIKVTGYEYGLKSNAGTKIFEKTYKISLSNGEWLDRFIPVGTNEAFVLRTKWDSVKSKSSYELVKVSTTNNPLTYKLPNTLDYVSDLFIDQGKAWIKTASGDWGTTSYVQKFYSVPVTSLSTTRNNWRETSDQDTFWAAWNRAVGGSDSVIRDGSYALDMQTLINPNTHSINAWESDGRIRDLSSGGKLILAEVQKINSDDVGYDRYILFKNGKVEADRSMNDLSEGFKWRHVSGPDDGFIYLQRLGVDFTNISESSVGQNAIVATSLYRIAESNLERVLETTSTKNLANISGVQLVKNYSISELTGLKSIKASEIAVLEGYIKTSFIDSSDRGSIIHSGLYQMDSDVDGKNFITRFDEFGKVTARSEIPGWIDDVTILDKQLFIQTQNDSVGFKTFHVNVKTGLVTEIPIDLYEAMGGDNFEQYAKVIVGTVGSEILGSASLSKMQYLFGANGDDVLIGSSKEDQLYGGAGNDTLRGNRDNDYLDGGAGIDWASYQFAGGAVTVNLATGRSSGADGVDTIRNIESIHGGAYNDTLIGNSGSNTLRGNRGNDILDGGAGIDWVSYSDASGAVTVNLATGKSSGADGVDTIRNIESIHGGAYNDTLIGNSGSNTLRGNRGNDILDGGAGIDWVSYRDASGAVTVNLATGKSSGADGVDTIRNIENISGGAHNDTLIGNSGLNILFGGLGSDSLHGGVDRVRDIFAFGDIAESKVGASRDKIFNFVSSADDIDLKTIDANTKVSGDQAFKFTVTTAKANSVWYKSADVDGSSKTKDIIIYGDVNGDAKADFEIGLVGVTSIASTDFIL